MLFRRFWRSRRGNFAIMFAMVFPALIAAVGAALDVTNIVTARANLQSALDAGMLAASRLEDKQQSREEVFQSFFKANVAGNQELKNPAATIAIEESVTSIKAHGKATADVVLHFVWIFGLDAKVAVNASTYQANDALEVVLALDNTGSMAGARIAALRTAATTLVNMLQTAKGKSRDVRVSLVPFVTAVNIKGDGFDMSWIDQTGLAPLNGANFVDRSNHLGLFAKLGVAWKGCVEARPSPYNISDDAPNPLLPATLFVPYFAPDDPGVARAPSSSYGNSATDWNNSYLDDMVTGNDQTVLASTAKYASSTVKLVNETAPLTVGPNRACPTPVVPLTDDFDKVRAAVSQMKEWNGSGTNVSEGLTWAMRMLSPGQPFNQGKPFKTSGVSKVVVLLTDGENVVYGASNKFTKSDYGSYGYLASGRFGSSSQSGAARNVDDWVLSVCSALKDKEVQIYTVVLQADTAANRALYSACASSPSNYYPTDDVSQLNAVFTKIGASIAKLHLTN